MLKRALFSLLSITLLLAGCAEESPSIEPPTPVQIDTVAMIGTRPNIIMADDMGFADLDCYGSEIKTPSIDKLANEGMRFTNFYNAGRYCPTRASLLTRLYAHQTGIGLMLRDYNSPTYRGFLNRKCVTMAEVLQNDGYRTYMSGKGHVEESPESWPRQRGFDEYFGLINGVSSYFDHPDGRIMAQNDESYLPHAGFYVTDAIGNKAVQYIWENEADSVPFSLMVTFTAPHFPLHALEADIAKYDGVYEAGWDNIRANRFERMKALGIVPENTKLSQREQAILPWEEVQDHEIWSRRMAVYAAMIDRMDQQIGHVMAALEQSGKADNTIVIFLSDNGGSNEANVSPVWNDSTLTIGSPESYTVYIEPWANVSDVPFTLYKEFMHEGGITTPLIAWWPEKIKPKSITDRAGQVIDMMATVLDLAGVQYPTELNDSAIYAQRGSSLLPVFQGLDRKQETPLFWEHKGNRAIRKDNWKLVSIYANTWELYDLENDRFDSKNLAQANPKKVDELSQLWQAWANEIDVIPRDSIIKRKLEQDTCCG
jgi:arylsulfatase A-like enzyme